MRERILTLFAIPVLVAGVAAQTPAKKPAPAGGIPRMADGHPDLQGTYDLGTLTPLERARRHAARAHRRRGEEARAAGRAAQRRPERADRRQPPGAAERRRRLAGTVRQRRRLQQLLARSRIALHDDRRPEARVAPHRSAGRPRAAADRGGAAAPHGRRLRPADVGPGRARRRSRIRRVRRPTTIRRSGRSPSAACSASARRRVRRSCRPTSTTTCIRSCRRAIT